MLSNTTNLSPQPDILIAGAGIIGLSLALELHSRGARVTVIERDAALSQASTAAAGMLAADDPYNHPKLHCLSRYSIALFPAYLKRLETLSGLPVPLQTDTTIQYLNDGSTIRLDENSVDPGHLAPALLAAVKAAGIKLHEHTKFHSLPLESLYNPRIESREKYWNPEIFISTLGAWHEPWVRPIKGQLMRVALPTGFPLNIVHRSEKAYVLPRSQGPQAGSALIGATVEDAGFDFETRSSDLARLRQLASELVPEVASEHEAPELEAWAGVRPATLDKLPIIGPTAPDSQHFIANGHFRNGILLAPATAVALADLIEKKTPLVDLSPFSFARFSPV